MTIYAVVNTKGGVGKTTTAVHLASMLARTDSTLLIDGDPQESAASWTVWRRDAKVDLPSPTTTCLVNRAILTEGRDLASRFTHTVVDAGGRDSVGLRSALLLASKAIVPVGVSGLDAAAITDLLTIVELAKDCNPGLTVHVLLTRIDLRTKDLGSMIEYLKDHDLDVLNSIVAERVVFRRATSEGLTVQEMDKKDKAAIAEIESFFKEVTEQ